MPNMSYCRFHNTLADLQDCYDAIQEMMNSFHHRSLYKTLNEEFTEYLKRDDDLTEDEQDEMDRLAAELDDLSDKIGGLSDDEYVKALALLELCQQITDEIEVDDLIKESSYPTP